MLRKKKIFKRKNKNQNIILFKKAFQSTIFEVIQFIFKGY